MATTAPPPLHICITRHAKAVSLTGLTLLTPIGRILRRALEAGARRGRAGFDGRRRQRVEGVPSIVALLLATLRADSRSLVMSLRAAPSSRSRGKGRVGKTESDPSSGGGAAEPAPAPCVPLDARHPDRAEGRS
jgi:hypothetical protein